MNFWTPENIRECTGGKWLAEPPADAGTVAGVTTDSRSVRVGQAFFALRGEKFDGHDYLTSSAQSGAAVLVVSDAEKARSAHTGKVGVILVEDTLFALQKLASAYRDHLRACGTRVIGVVGSNGKTTTRNLIHTVLAAAFRGTQSPKSFNNHIGVPLTILAAGAGTAKTQGVTATRKTARRGDSTPHKDADDFVVVEIGTNHPGEVDALARLARPDAVVVTSIGHEHMEFFKTLDGVAIEEASILPHVAPDGLAVIEGDAATRFERLKLIPEGLKVWTYGPHHAESAATFYDEPVTDGDTQTFTTRGGKLIIRLPILGTHNAVNALAATLIGKWMGMEDDLIAAALAQAKPVDMRMNVLHLGTGAAGVTLINDAYNANPSSVVAALRTVAALPTPAPEGRRIAILGDMLELGEESPDLHRYIGKVIAESSLPFSAGAAQASRAPGFNKAIFVGKLAFFMAEALSKVWPASQIEVHPTWDEALPGRIAAAVQPGDLVLIKASRGMGLERLAAAIQLRFNG
ncbi:MAG: UDP-N-acetylmuramoyl-tripeptide--D-alanyl-D-alanine ligase [Planctomycetes bacterium]|nr:UDP-N-acetylmuramoyl-tripeptide--D-alanyl-D-alanine ligase [Planctomycetota bacterium]